MSSTTDKISGQWKQIKGKVQEKYGELTDDDVAKAEGKKENLVGIIQEKTGKAKEEVKSFIDNL